MKVPTIPLIRVSKFLTGKARSLKPKELPYLNFLAVPDGQRLFAINCSGCHGTGISFSGTESQLRNLISKGGQHLSIASLA